MILNGRIALVTGGGRGIGAAISLALAEDGADIAIFYRRDAPAAQATVEKIEALGRRAQAYAAAVDDLEACKLAVDAIGKQLGPVSILVNNAGIASRGKSVVDTDPAEMERVVRVHAFGPYYLSQLLVPIMRTQARGDIIMISSVATRRLSANGAPYNMGKAALEALAATLAKEVHRDGIFVNTVCAPLTATQMGERLAKAVYGVQQDIHELNNDSGFGRICEPADIANVVRYLVSAQNSYVTGERIYVHGGVP